MELSIKGYGALSPDEIAEVKVNGDGVLVPRNGELEKRLKESGVEPKSEHNLWLCFERKGTCSVVDLYTGGYLSRYAMTSTLVESGLPKRHAEVLVNALRRGLVYPIVIKSLIKESHE